MYGQSFNNRNYFINFINNEHFAVKLIRGLYTTPLYMNQHTHRLLINEHTCGLQEKNFELDLQHAKVNRRKES